MAKTPNAITRSTKVASPADKKSVAVDAPAKAKRQVKKAPAATPRTTVPGKSGTTSTASAPKAVRDSFTMTAADHELIKRCKRDAVTAGRDTKKSEVIRAALQHFAALPVAERVSALSRLEVIKTGRPNKNKK